MLVLFFHVLYLLGNYVVRRYSGGIKQDRDDDYEEDRDSGVEASSWTCEEAMSKETKERVNLKRRLSGDLVDDHESKSTIRFNPPAFIQRYQAVQKVFEDPRFRGKLKKVVDFGCSELGFSMYLKSMAGVEEALFVDVDRVTLERYSAKAKPLHVDYLHRRSTPLVMRVLEGSVNHHDKMLEDVDAVVCIELIEHLYPDDLNNFSYSIFGFIKPKLAIVTTPNADFNVLFENMSQFRHWDHKFEWTRSQFQDWANNATLRFPEYDVTFHGICDGPPGTEHLGACSQMAVFYKARDSSVARSPGTEGLIKIVNTYEYPYEIDNRSDEQKILDDAVYYIRKFSINNEEMEEEIPLRMIINIMKYPVTENDLREILQNNNWSIEDREGGLVVMVPPPTSFSDQSMNPEDFLDDIDNDDDDDDGGDYRWGIRDPGPSAEYFFNRHVEHHDVDSEVEEDWENEPNVIVTNAQREPRNMEENDGWGELPPDGNSGSGDECDYSEYANTTSSIFADDINLDDVESHTSETPGSPEEESNSTNVDGQDLSNQGVQSEAYTTAPADSSSSAYAPSDLSERMERAVDQDVESSDNGQRFPEDNYPSDLNSGYPNSSSVP